MHKTKLVAITVLICLLFISYGCSSPTTSSPRALKGEDLDLIWTYETGGPINLSPLPAGDILIVAPRGGPAMGLNMGTGARRWTFEPPDGIWERAITGDASQVYIGLQGGSLAALETKTGALRWETNLGIEIQTPPRLDNDTLYVSSTFVGPGLDGDPLGKAKLFALDIKTGDILWAFESDNYILQTAFILEDQIYVGGSYSDPSIEVDEGGPMRIYALSKSDGSINWTYEGLDGYIKALYAADGVISYIAYQDFINSLDTSSGDQTWRKETGNWVPYLAGYDETIYFGSANTIVHAWNIQDGSVIWSYNIPEGSFNYLLGAPVRVENDLYFLTQHGEISALDATDGSALWSIPTGTRSRVGLSVSDGMLFFGDENGIVYAYSDHK